MSLFGGPTRKKVNLSDLLHHDLSKNYALAARYRRGVSALSATKPAEAEIVYTPAHSVLSHDGVIRIDLNHDGLNGSSYSARSHASTVSSLVIHCKPLLKSWRWS